VVAKVAKGGSNWDDDDEGTSGSMGTYVIIVKTGSSSHLAAPAVKGTHSAAHSASDYQQPASG